MKKKPATPRKLSDKRKNTHPNRAEEERKSMIDRKDREKILKISEIRYRRLFEAARDGILLLDAKTGQITDVNPYLVEILGYSRQEFLGKKLWEVGLFKDVAANQAGFRKLQKEKYVRYEHLPLEIKSGGHVDVEFVSNVYEEDQKAVIQCNIRNITQRKQSEDEIRQTLSLLKATLESTADGILVVTREGRIVSFNQHFVGMWHIPQSIIDTYDDNQALAFVLDQIKDPQGFLDKVKDLYQQPEEESFDVLEFKDGRVLERYSRPQRIGEEIVGRVWSFRDVTARKKTEEALRISEEKYRNIFENAVEGIFQSTPDGKYINVNPAFAKINGFQSPEEMIRSVKDVQKQMYVHPEDRDRLIELLSREGEVKHFEAEMRRRDGSIIWSSMNVRPVRDKDQRLIYIEGMIEDITERKKAEEACRESEERFRLAFENANIGVCLVDLKGNLTKVNNKMCEIFGYTQEELERMTVNDIAYSEDIDKSQNFIRDTLQGKIDSKIFEKRYIHKQGHLVTCQVTSSLVRGTDGFPLYFISHIQDITARRHAENELREIKERFQAQYEKNPIPTFTWQRKGEDFELVDYNSAAQALTEGRVAQFIGRKAKEMYKDRPYILEEFYRCWEKKRVIKREGKSQNFVPGRDVIVTYAFIPKNLVMVHIEDITERKQAVEALKESESKFRNIIETSKDGIIFFEEKERKIIFGNDAMAGLLGCSKEDLIGRSLPLKHPPEDLEKIGQRFQKHMSGKITVSTEIPVLRDDGSVFYADITSCGITLEGKTFISTFFRDITEQKQADEALRKEKEKAQNYLDIVEVVMVAIDAGQKVVLMNQKGYKILGYDEGEILGKNWFDHFIPEKNRGKTREIFLKVLSGEFETVEYFENPVLTKSGQERIIAWHNTVIRDEAGRVTGTLSSGEDITVHKKAEEALKDSQERLHQIFDNSGDGIVLSNKDGDILECNQAFLRIHGYTSQEEIIGKNVMDFICPEDLQTARDVFDDYNRNPKIAAEYRPIEFRGMKKDGTFPLMEVRGHLVKDAEENIQYNISFIRDITERRRDEKERAELQEQLRQSQKMEAIGQLAGGIAHDFNNLLTIIEGYCQLSILEIRQEDPLRENITEIRKAADQAAFLTRQFLAFSRRQIMEMRVMDPNMLIQNLSKMLRRIIGEDIELVTMLDEAAGRIKSDPGQIEQVIMNLAVNAKDAMPQGGMLIIETGNVDLDDAYAQSHLNVTPGHYVMISVSDNGTGIPPEVKDRIFEPFFTTKEVGKGTGLGLSTVYGIIKQSGGNIWVYSEPGAGTTFKIYMPRVEAPLEEYREQLGKENLPRGSETLLVVEDNEEVRKLAVRVLQRQGYHILEAVQGGEALLICEKHQDTIHLMLTDVVMPGMSGHDLAKRLHSLHPEMKVLYMSGYTANAIVHQGILEEGIDFIQKPFTIDLLARKVREVLDHS